MLSPAAVFTFTLGRLSLVAGGAGAKLKAPESNAAPASDAGRASDEAVLEVEAPEMPCGDFEGGEEEVPVAHDACVEESSETASKPQAENVD